tara:strand:+ start:17781 stop:19004 length:1224 start_codon:yes stop_codon:yes gene_type:complete
MNLNPAPNFCLMSSVDISGYSGNLLTRSNTVNFSNFTNSKFEDMISFLNGRGMNTGFNLPAQLLASSQALGGFGSNWFIGIDANDKIEISSSHAFKIKFNASSTLIGNKDYLGIGNDFVVYSGSATIGNPLLSFKVSAPQEWTRGEVISFSYIIEEVGSGSGSFNFNFIGGAQDLTVLCRLRGNSDLDDNPDCLEALDIAKNNGDIRYYVNNSGKVTISSIGLSNVTWNNSDFRNRLGFTGEESVSTINGYSVLVASNFCPGVLVTSRPYQSSYIDVSNQSEARRKIGGGYTSNYIGTYLTTVLNFDLDARLDLIDLYRHFTNNFISYISKGERINFYQVLGDSRRALISAYSNISQPPHNLLYTSSRNGSEGRIRASLITETYSLNYPSGLARRVPISMRLEHLNE